MQASRAPRPEPRSTRTPSPEPHRSGRHKILYIDCDPPPQGFDSSRIAWMGDVQAEDIDLITAAPGECGLELARSCRPDLILLDLGLPRTSGIAAVTQLRESRETYLIPIVALSSTACENVPGLSMYCRRPIKTPEFLAMLRVLLGRAHLGSKEDPRRPSRGSRRRRITSAESDRGLAGARPAHYTE